MRLLRPGRSRGRALWSGRGVPCSARARASGSGAVDVLSVVEQAALDAGARPVFGEGGREGSVAVEEELGVDLSCGGWWCGFNVPARVGAASVGARGHALEGLGTTGGAEEPVEERGPLRSFRRGLACGCGRYAALGASVAGASGVGLAVLLQPSGTEHTCRSIGSTPLMLCPRSLSTAAEPDPYRRLKIDPPPGSSDSDSDNISRRVRVR